MSSVWEHSSAREGALLVMLAIADFADDLGNAYPSVETIANKARLSVRMTQYALKSLVESGELAIKRNAGPRGCHIYRVQILHPKDLQLLQGANIAGVDADSSIESTTNSGGAIIAGVQFTTSRGATHCTRTVSKPKTKDTPVSDEVPSKPKKQNKVDVPPSDFSITEELKTWAAKNGYGRLEDRLEYFRDYIESSGKRYADWQAAFRNSIRGDWAKLNGAVAKYEGELL